MAEYKEIIIDWDREQSIKNIEKKSGLYQIYGNHPVYGKNTLLYIGMSKELKKRKDSHLGDVFNWQHDLEFYYGEIKDFEESLTIPESILIANHKPAFNKSFLHTLSKSELKLKADDEAKNHIKGVNQKIIIINNGNPGMLNKCCTNFWWVDGK